MTGIDEMFAELDGYGRYEVAVYEAYQRGLGPRYWRTPQQKRAEAEAVKAWRAANPEKLAAQRARAYTRYRAAHLDKLRASQARASRAYRARRAVARRSA